MTQEALVATAAAYIASGNPKVSPWYAMADGRAFRVTRESDVDTSLEHGLYGRIYSDERGRSTRQRPKECNGAAVRLTSRQGPLWWQPDPELVAEGGTALESVRERVQEYFLEYWDFIGISVELCGLPCTCCGKRATTSDALFGIESDSGEEYFREMISLCLENCLASWGAQ